MSRSVDLWVGKTDDTRPPPRVRLRVFDKHDGICHISGRKINPGDNWELDHIVALVNGGKNDESNLAPALKDAHKPKTAADVAAKAKTDRVRKKHLGIGTGKKALIPGSKGTRFKRKIDGTVVAR